MRNTGRFIPRVIFCRLSICPETVSFSRCIIGEGSDVYGKVYNSVVGCGVTIGEGAVVRDSIIMNNVVIGAGCEINKAIIAENVQIGKGVKLGVEGGGQQGCAGQDVE